VRILLEALKSVTHQRGFAAAALICIALGVGAASAILAIVHAVVLKPLPYVEPDRLVALWESNPSLGQDFLRTPVSALTFEDIERHSRFLESVAAVNFEAMVVTGLDEPRRVPGARATPGFFLEVFPTTPMLGRTFLPSDAVPGGEAVVLLSHGFWQRALGGDPKVVGEVIRVDDTPCEVVGVLPPHFVYENPDPDSAQGVDLWRPLVVEEYRTYGRGMRFLQVVGRRAPGVTLEQAQSDVDTVMAGITEASELAGAGWKTILKPLQEQLVAHVRRELFLLLGGVVLVFLVACGNVANLFLVRTVQRNKDLAVRLALGARRSHLVRLLFAEGVILSLAGGTLGFFLAYWLTGVLLASSPVNVPRLHEFQPVADLLPAVVLLSLVSALLCVLPALPLTVRRISLESLKEGDRTGESFGNFRLRHGLVLAELALAMALLAGGGVLVKSFWLLHRQDLGFRSQGVLTLHLELPWSHYPSKNQTLSFYTDLTHRLSALPGVVHAGLVKDLPLGGEGSKVPVIPEGPAATGASAELDTVWTRVASREYFQALRIPLIEGRLFDSQDVAAERMAVLLNESLARSFWPGETPLGRRVTVKWFGQEIQGSVIGVVGDVRHRSPALPPEPAIYLDSLSFPYSSTYLVLQGSGPPTRWIPMVHGVLEPLDSDLPLDRVQPVDDVIAEASSKWRFLASLIGAFAVTALVLATVGLYGVVAYTVSRSTRQIAIRMALGAEPRRILKGILLQTLALSGAGLAVGSLLALAAGGLISHMLYGVSPNDPMVLGVTASLLMSVVALAAYIPARRAATLDPAIALRTE
jgi:putative ABC transport system permease protein